VKISLVFTHVVNLYRVLQKYIARYYCNVCFLYIPKQ